MIKLDHYSDDPKLQEKGIQPEFHGTGVRGGESKRKQHPHWVDRSYHYISGAEPESQLATKSHKYQSDVPKEKIYDFYKDPDGLMSKAKWGNTVDTTTYEKAIKDAGYMGFHSQGMDHPVMKNVVALFYPVKPHSVERKEMTKSNKGWRHDVRVADISANSLEKAKKDEQKKVFGSHGSKKGLDKYLKIVEDFARDKLGLHPVRATSPGVLEKLHSKPVKEIDDQVKAQHNWKFAEASKKYIHKPSFFEKDGKWHVAHLGTAKSLIHELAHIIRADKSIPDLDASMQRGFGKIKQAGLLAHKQAKAEGKSDAEVKIAAKKANQFGWPGEYETMGVEQLMARHLGLPPNVTAAYVENPEKDKPEKPAQVSMTTGQPIHKKVPGSKGATKHITHLSENVPPKVVEKFDKLIRGEIKYDPNSGWHPASSPDAKINIRERQVAEQKPGSKDKEGLMKKTLKKDDKPHGPETPEDKAHDVLEEGQPLQSAIKELGMPEKIKQMFEHIKGAKEKGWHRSPTNQSVGADKLGEFNKSKLAKQGGAAVPPPPPPPTPDMNAQPQSGPNLNPSKVAAFKLGSSNPPWKLGKNDDVKPNRGNNCMAKMIGKAKANCMSKTEDKKTPVYLD